MTSGATACTATTRTTWKVMKRRTSLTGHAARCCGRRCELLKGSPMPRPVSLLRATLAVGFLVLYDLTRSDAQTGLPAASTHRLTQRRADLEQRLQHLVGMAETGHYDKGVSPDGVRTETTYSVPVDAVIPAVLMAAGGTTHDTKLTKLKIQRNGKTIWEGDALRQAMAAGSTVDDLELRPGDAIVVPRGGSISGLYGPAQLVAVLLGIPVTIYTLTRIIH